MHRDRITADEADLVAQYREFDAAGQRYVTATAEALAADVDGSILELLRRHEAGERVAAVYLDAETGEHVRIPDGQPVPRRHFPLVGLA